MDLVEESLKLSGMAAEEAESVMVRVAENAEAKALIEGSIATEESANGLTRDILEGGNGTAEDVSARTLQSADQKVVNKRLSEFLDKVEEKGLLSATADSVEKPMTKVGLDRVEELGPKLSDEEFVAKLKTALKKPTKLAKQIFQGIKKNWGKLLFTGVTLAVVITWLANGHGIQDLVVAAGNVVEDLGKNLIGAFAGVAKTIADPIGKGIGGVFKTVGTVVGIAVAVAVVVVGVYYVIKKVRENKNQKIN